MRGGKDAPVCYGGGGHVGVSSVTPPPHDLPHHPHADSYCSSTKSVIVKREASQEAEREPLQSTAALTTPLCAAGCLRAAC